MCSRSVRWSPRGPQPSWRETTRSGKPTSACSPYSRSHVLRNLLSPRPCSGADPSSILGPMRFLVTVLLIAAACGGKQSTTTTPKEGEAKEAEAAAVVLPDVPSDKLEHEQRIAFMKQKVEPAMRPVYQHHAPKDFAQFGWSSCHGEQAKEGHFDMPNPKLPKLNFTDMSKFKKEDIEWMKAQVMPTMGKILQLPLY